MCEVFRKVMLVGPRRNRSPKRVVDLTYMPRIEDIQLKTYIVPIVIHLDIGDY